MKPIKDKEYLCIENLPGFNKEEFYICTGPNTFKKIPDFNADLSDEDYEIYFSEELDKLPNIELNLEGKDFDEYFMDSDDVRYTLSPKGCFYAVMTDFLTDKEIERGWNVFEYRINKLAKKSKFSRFINNIFGTNPRNIFTSTLKGLRFDLNDYQISLLYDDFVKTMKQHENI